MGVKSAGEKLGIDVSAVYKIINAFFKNFSGLKTWMTCAKKEALKNGYVATIFGRRRYLPDINSPNANDKAKAERQAVNTVIQGSASDLIKHVMVRIESILDEYYPQQGGMGTSMDMNLLRPRIMMQIHDELIYEVPLQNANATASFEQTCSDPNVAFFSSLLVEYMTKTVVSELELHVPLKANVTIGRDWGNMNKMVVQPLGTNIKRQRTSLSPGRPAGAEIDRQESFFGSSSHTGHSNNEEGTYYGKGSAEPAPLTPAAQSFFDPPPSSSASASSSSRQQGKRSID
jgi:hypothetical protein